jgi:hypothetical protein
LDSILIFRRLVVNTEMTVRPSETSVLFEC